MNKNKIISKVMLKLSQLDQEQFDFLNTLLNVKDPKELQARLQKRSSTSTMNRQELIQFLSKAKQIGVFKKHFVIPSMEKVWRLWIKDLGLANQFRFES